MADTCKKCGKSTNSGSITQWISACKCGQLDKLQPPPEDVRETCATCGKTIGSGRAGSLTMWVFGPNMCACKNGGSLSGAAVVDVLQVPAEPVSLQGWIDSLNPDKNLQVDAQLFPQERYQPIQRLGHGAAGDVYLCADLILQKKVAVKTLRELNPEQLVSFQQEAKATSTLTHPSIVTILDFGVNEGVAPYMVMDYIPGTGLDKILKEHEKLSAEELVEIALQLCDAIGYAHSMGIFHRDLKPSNILIAQQNDRMRVHVIDFGIAKVRGKIDSQDEQSTTLAGTPAYMSPDQVSGKDFDARSEIYSLGCVMFECLSGYLPFVGSTVLETLAMHANSEPPTLPEDVPDKVDEIVIRCMMKDPDERFQNMGELAVALKELEPGRGSQSLMETQSAQIPPRTFDLKLPIALLVAVLLCLAGSTFINRHISDVPRAKISITGLDDQPMTSLYGEDIKQRMATQSYTFTRLMNVDDQSMKVFKGYRDARTVDLARMMVTDKGIAYLVDSPVSYLKLVEDDIKDLQNVSRLTYLDYLNLDHTDVTDDSIKDLTKLKMLKTLTLAGTEITDDGLQYLEQIPTLCIVNLYKTQVTADKVKELSAKMPFCDFKTFRSGEALQLYKRAGQEMKEKKLDDAQKDLEHSLEIIEKAQGKDSAALMVVLRSLYQHYWVTGQKDKAMETCSRAVAIGTSTGYLRELSKAYSFMATLLRSQSKWKEAEEYQKKATEIVLVDCGTKSNFTYDTLLLLAETQLKTKDYEAALATFRKAMLSASTDGEIGSVYLSLGNIKMIKGKYDKAIPLLEEALKNIERDTKWTPKFKRTKLIATTARLSSVCELANDLDAAIDYQERTVRLLKESGYPSIKAHEGRLARLIARKQALIGK